MKKIVVSLITLVLVVLSFGSLTPKVSAAGFTTQSGDTVVVSDSVDGALFVTGNHVTIEGDVNGLLFTGGQTVLIEGDVNGTVFASGSQVTIEGSGAGDVFAAGETVTIGESAELARDAFLAGNNISVNGTVGRDLFVGSNTTNIQNQIGRDVRISGNSLAFSDNGQVAGNLYYQTTEEVANVDQHVEGEVQFQQVEQETEDQGSNLLLTLVRTLGVIVGAVLIWLFLRGISRGSWITISPELRNKTLSTWLIGLGMLFLIPIVTLIALVSVFFTNVGIFMLMLFSLIMFLGKLIVASVIGKYLIEPRMKLNKYNGLASFTIAYVVLYVIGLVPFIGWIVSLLTVIYALGLAVRESIVRSRKERVETSDI